METKEKNKKLIGYVMLVVTFIIWGSNYVANKFATSSIPGQAVAGIRNIVSLLPIWLLARREMPFPKVEKEDRKYFFLIGFLGYYLMHNINTIGIMLTNASTSGTINGLTPVSITLIAAFVLKEKLDWVKLLCLGLAIAGTLVVSSGALTGSPLGIALLILGLCLWGLASVFIRRLTKKYPAIQVTFYSVLIGACFHLPTVAITAIVKGGLDITLPTALSVLYCAFAVSAVGHVLWGKCLAIFEASFCSMFYPLQALFATLLGVIILKESVGPRFFIGLALITADVVILCLHNRRLEREAAKPGRKAPEQQSGSVR